MLMIAVENIHTYLTLPSAELKACLRCCCGGVHFILWGKYQRRLLPDGRFLSIQRVRCQGCKRTHGVLPSFVLGQVRHPASVIEIYFEAWIKQAASLACLWRESASDAPQSLSTLYRWGRRFCWTYVNFSPGLASRSFICGPGF